MTLTSNTPVKLTLGVLVTGFIAIVAYFLAPHLSSNKEEKLSPSIQNIQNNNNFPTPSTPSFSNNFQAHANSLELPEKSINVQSQNKYAQLDNENAQLKTKISELTNANVAWQKYSDQQSQEINRLKKAIDSRKEILNEIKILNKKNSDYFDKVQITGGFYVGEPTPEQKADYRNAIAQNLEIIKGYQTQLKALSN